MSNLPNRIVNFIEKTPPYVKEIFELSELADLSDTTKLSIKQYCKNCDENSVFVTENINYEFRHLASLIMSNQPNGTETVNTETDDYFFELEFFCARCREKHIFYIKNNFSSFMKVGQYPSFADMQGIEINRYKNLISKYFIEFKSSLNCYSQGKGIAAFVYLRRILEHLIIEEYNKLPEKSTNEIHFVDKMKLVQEKIHIIPIELEDIKDKLYSVLSKGIHEYEEIECLQIYDCVKYIIEDILDKKLYEKERLENIKIVKQKLLSIQKK